MGYYHPGFGLYIHIPKTCGLAVRHTLDEQHPGDLEKNGHSTGHDIPDNYRDYNCRIWAHTRNPVEWYASLHGYLAMKKWVVGTPPETMAKSWQLIRGVCGDAWEQPWQRFIKHVTGERLYNQVLDLHDVPGMD